jgi:hypothetical protein
MLNKIKIVGRGKGLTCKKWREILSKQPDAENRQDANFLYAKNHMYLSSYPLFSVGEGVTNLTIDICAHQIPNIFLTDKDLELLSKCDVQPSI